MRPPEFTGGNATVPVIFRVVAPRASMRPPEFTGGNEVVVVGGAIRVELQ